MRDVTDKIPALIAHINVDERYTFVNPTLSHLFEVGTEEIVGKTMREVHDWPMYKECAPYVAQVLDGNPVSFESTGKVKERLHHYQSSYVPDFDESGDVRGFFAMTFDITALKEAQAVQARVEQRLRAITDSLPALIGYVDKDERYRFLNATFMRWLGIDPVASVGRKMVDVIGPEVFGRRRELLRRCLAGERIAFEALDNPTLMGRKVLQIDYIPDIEHDGSVAGMYTLSYDVTELKEAQASLAKLVRSDSLTGLHNRYQFNETLPLAILRSKRAKQAMALMFLDIDHFKQINDNYGHPAGDQVLKEFAQRLLGSVRSTDLVARLAGDEFVVILEGLHSEAEPQLVASKILAEVNRPFYVDGHTLNVSTSVGISFHATADLEAQQVLARADEALYQAKASGRNSYRLSLN